VTRYLDGKPFSSRPATRAYRDNFDATFGAKVKCEICGIVGRADPGRRAPQGWECVSAYGHTPGWACLECQK
jgi:hypothetical protein